MASEATTVRAGGCLCGQVRFRTTGAPLNVRCCHCRTCQRALAGPYFARALFAGGQYAVEGEVTRYATSERIERVSCRLCGTRVMAERRDGSAAGLALALFDDLGAFPLECHMFVADKAPWLVLDDGLPQYAERPPA